MSRIRRLGIRGIRNFGPGDNQKDLPTIIFSHPLTLILGPNGTGKTTIIECLKYATTGDFPPGASSKTNSFIHDLSLTNECVVRGMVKAEFLDCKGDIVTVSRRVECTQKKNVRKFQTIDTTLSRKNKETGKTEAISHRCADVDIEMSLAMGVSKAMLNYVIFCHQEDSTWPLEDGKKLKERFDQIFDSDKYNKAVEKIRKLWTKLRSDVRVSKAQKDSCKLVLEEANDKTKSLRTAESRLKKSVEEVNEVLVNLKPISARLKEIDEVQLHYMEVHTANEKKRTAYSLLKQQITDLRKNIKVIHEGTVEELHAEIASHSDLIASMGNEVESLKRNLQDVTNDEGKLKVLLGNQQIFVGKLKQQVQAQEKNITLRNMSLSKMLVSEGLEDIRPRMAEIEVMACIDQIKEKCSRMEANIKKMAVEYEDEEFELQKALDVLRHKQSTIESQIIMSKKQIAEKRKDASKIRSQLDEVNASSTKLDRMDLKIQEANAKIDALTAKFDVEEMKKEIENEIKIRNQMEVNLDQINKEVTLLQQQSSLHAELELHKSALVTKEKDIQKLRNKYEDSLKVLLGVETLPEMELKRALSRVQEELSDEIKNLNNGIQKQQREIISMETTRKHKENELKEQTAELQSNKEHITSMCHYKDYDEVLLHIKTSIKDLQDTRGLYAYKSIAYKDYIKNLDKSESCCPLCHRGFDNDQDRDELKSELNDELNKYPNQSKACEEKLKAQQKRYDDLLQLKPLVTKVKQMEEVTLKNLSQQLDNLKKKLTESYTRIESLQLSLAEPESKLAQCKDIVGDVALWDQYAAEISKLNQTIKRVKDRMPNQVIEKTMKQAQTEQESQRTSLHNLRKRIENLQSTLSLHSDELQRARETRNKLVEEQLKLQSGVQKLQQLKDKLTELTAGEATILESIEKMQEKLEPLTQKLATESRALHELKLLHQEKLEDDRQLAAQKFRKLDELVALQSEIQESFRNKVVDDLKRCEADIEKYEKKAQELEKNKTALSGKINELISKISNQETRKREMNDNMTLKEKTTDAMRLKQEIEEFEMKLGGMNCQQLSAEKKKLIKEEETLIREKNVSQGSQTELEHNIVKLKQELNKDVYRFAKKNYIEKCTEVIVQQEAIENLVAYTTALDKAIIEFHEERMATVNKIILNLWELIYKGKDTTAIQIQTDHTEGTGTKRRTYNYKVVQEKQKVLMDMKGRCSAGQKVLASLIIRMALAETFAKNCGIFALDEPTTNLDETNMNSLAQALATIVNIRSKHQKNFQLIVISHDESFVTRLTKTSNVQKVWELYRNDVGLTELKMWCAENNSMSAAGPSNQADSDVDSDSEEAKINQKRKQLAEERKAQIRQNLTKSPPRKKRY